MSRPRGAAQPGQPGVPAPKPPLTKPRRVRGGIKLPAESSGLGDSSAGWASQRWARLVELVADGERVKEGLEYAQLGQTKRLNIESGRIDALVQGREVRAYVTRIEFDTLGESQWGQVVAAMAEGAIYAAKLLSGEVPANIEELFAPLGLRLFPTDTAEVRTSCSCGLEKPWCKHACCVAHLFAARLSSEPFLMFALRGLGAEELQERLRQRRSVASAASDAVNVYVQRIPGVADAAAPPLEKDLERFYDVGPQLAELDFPVGPPPVSYPLLRRLGPSPFQNAQFPLVGLLASCYNAISEDAQQTPTEPAQPTNEDTGEGSDEAGPPPLGPGATMPGV